jgi:hypothetical protein
MTITRAHHYADASSGAFLGTVVDLLADDFQTVLNAAPRPAGSVEVPVAPDHAAQLWNGASWGVLAASVTAPQQLAQRLASGCAIVSTATPALSATYPIDPAAQAKLAAIVTGINAGRGLPHGAATVQWPDIAGAFHAFAAADLVNFAAAIEGYVYDLILTESALIGGHAATWPAQPVTMP